MALLVVVLGHKHIYLIYKCINNNYNNFELVSSDSHSGHASQRRVGGGVVLVLVVVAYLQRRATLQSEPRHVILISTLDRQTYELGMDFVISIYEYSSCLFALCETHGNVTELN